MTRTKLFVLVCFCVAFAAGISLGVVWTQFRGRPPRRSWITDKLGLTPDQREQMRNVWSAAMGDLRKRQREQRRAIREERDEAVRGLLNEKQKVQYEEVMKAYDEESSALDAARKAAFEKAVEQTKLILTEPQRKKYEELLKERPPFGRHRRGSSKERSHRSDGNTPSSNGE